MINLWYCGTLDYYWNDYECYNVIHIWYELVGTVKGSGSTRIWFGLLKVEVKFIFGKMSEKTTLKVAYSRI